MSGCVTTANPLVSHSPPLETATTEDWLVILSKSARPIIILFPIYVCGMYYTPKDDPHPQVVVTLGL